MNVRFVFVVGSPRSGTTLVGALLGSCASLFCPGEYFGFYVAHQMLPGALANIPSTVRDAYLAGVRSHALDFAARAAKDAGASMFCDATPWNLMIAAELSRALPDSVFVLCVRRPEGVVDSLRRSFDAGFRWAGASAAHRAKVYADFYERAADLPASRTIVFDYDACCARPEGELRELLQRAAAGLGVRPDCFDLSVAANSHASGPGSGVPLASVDARGHVTYRSRPSYDPSALSSDERAAVLTEARRALIVLRERFPGTIAASLAL